MSGSRLEVRVHIVTGAQSAAENIVKCVRRCGLEVEQLVLNPSASSQAVLTQDEVVDRTTRFVRTVPQLLDKFHAPLENADLRHAEGYAVKLKGVTINADVKAPQPVSREE